MKEQLSKVASLRALLDGLLNSGEVLPFRLLTVIGLSLDSINTSADSFNKLRVELCKSFADKDEDGTPIKEEVDGVEVYKIIQQKGKFEEEIKKLSEQEVEIEIYKCKFEDIDGSINISNFPFIVHIFKYFVQKPKLN